MLRKNFTRNKNRRRNFALENQIKARQRMLKTLKRVRRKVQENPDDQELKDAIAFGQRKVDQLTETIENTQRNIANGVV